MGRNAYTFSSTNQPKNGGRKKGTLNFYTEFERVYKLRKAAEIEKEMKDGTFKNVKLSAFQYLMNIRMMMLDDVDTPKQVKEKIIDDMMPYIVKKQAEQVEIKANVQGADLSHMSTEERLAAFRSLMGMDEEEEDDTASDS